ncbi:MAG TPA: M48 family metallopeptidase [Vicinamibacterales bacterium]|nr:M48 family metallopeptidase [Vicinamibacterales bacterium]
MNEDKATRYNRLKRQVSVVSVAWSVVFLLALVVSGGSAALRDAAGGVASLVAPASWWRAGTVAVYVLFITLLNEVGSFPLAFYGGFVLERRYGLSTQPLGAWLADQAKSLLLAGVLGIVAAVILYAFISRYPFGWWLPAAVVFALLILVLANLGPLLLLPMFYSIKPLSRDALRARLVALGQRAGARVLDAYEWGLGAKTSKANAALTGLGGSRRILVSDTMLAQYSDDEIEVVLAHELAHHVHGDIWKGLGFESALIVAGFFAASWLLRLAAPMAGLHGTDDVAGLPLLLLAAGAVSMVMVPAAHAMSRAHERRADRFALTLTRNPPAFISAMRRLAAQNLAEDEPSALVQWLFHSHPPIRERIVAAQNWRGQTPGSDPITR